MVQGSNRTAQGGNCNECATPQLARNNYFTGKLLVERDFTDEQRYHSGKQQRHNSNLHGAGCVCGLKVKQHPNTACQAQYVLIEPGTALDCCGHELLITHEEYFDFSAKIAAKKLQVSEDTTLQICLSYAECPTEQIPVLFDDCGGDDTASQPNRITESYSFDVRIAPAKKRNTLDDVYLKWGKTLHIANASRIIVDEANGRYLVLNANKPAMLMVYNLRDDSLFGAKTLETEATDIAISRDGTRVYVALKQKKSVQVYDIEHLGEPKGLLNELPAAVVPHDGVRLAVSPRNGFLYVLDRAQKTVTPWDERINAKNDDIDDAKHEAIKVGNAPSCIVSAPEGNWIFVSNSADKTISAIDAVNHEYVTLLRLKDNDIVPSELAVAHTDDGLKLYVADATNNTVSVLALELRTHSPFTLLGKLALTDKPVALAVSPTGRWLYALLADGAGKGHVQVIDAHRVERGEAYATGDTLPVGTVPHQIVLVANRQHLYALFQGTSEETDKGGFAVIDVIETTCEDLLKRALDDCPSCADDDEDDGCIVLATIKNYTASKKITDDVIDNFTDRHLLPSTDLITDVVRCMLENGGGKGRRGEEGPRGKNGEGIEDVDAKIVEPGQPGRAWIAEDDEKRTLFLEIPRGRDGQDFKRPEYTHICGINWVHRGERSKDAIEDQGIVIAFNRPIHAIDINRHTFQVLGHRNEDGMICWCELTGHARGVQLDLEPEEEGTFKIVGVHEPHLHPTYETLVNGAIFRAEELPFDPGTLRVILKGDLIRDERGHGIDANHLPPWLPERVSGDGIEGGTFESWFTVETKATAKAEETEEKKQEPARATQRRSQVRR